MSSGDEKRQRKRSTRVRRAEPAATTRQSITPDPTSSDLSAREHYRREKARRAEQVRPAEHPLEQARRAYLALLEADAERAKGGRPKKTIVPENQKPPASDE